MSKAESSNGLSRIEIFTDGSSQMKDKKYTGAGAVICLGGAHKEASLDDFDETAHALPKFDEYGFDESILLTTQYFLGSGTNNTAELQAIRIGMRGLQRLSEANHLPHISLLDVHVYSDSQYALRVIDGQYSAKKNIRLVERIQKEVFQFPNVTMNWVKGHSGHKYNEHADALANRAKLVGINNDEEDHDALRATFGGRYGEWMTKFVEEMNDAQRKRNNAAKRKKIAEKRKRTTVPSNRPHFSNKRR